MQSVHEGNLTLMFSDHWLVSKYDEWSHYQNHFRKLCSQVKAVDFLAVAPREVFWLIEIKDYRVYQRTKTIDLADELAEKVRDTLAGLVSAQFRANDSQEKKHGSSGSKKQIDSHSASPGTNDQPIKIVSQGHRPIQSPPANETVDQVH